MEKIFSDVHFYQAKSMEKPESSGFSDKRF